MNQPLSIDEMRPAGTSLEEWRLRLQLAACYRLFDFLGWTEMIYNHITVRVPGGAADNPHYLINPFGLHYAEVTARNLVKIDRYGTKLDDSPHPVNPAGFTIHSAVHSARPDAHCVMHTHTTAGMAVACKQSGLRHDNFYSAMIVGLVAYHEFEGLTTDPSECDRLVASMGDKPILILRSHGLLVAGPDLPSALQSMWTVQRGCEIQLASDCIGGPNVPVSPQALARSSMKTEKGVQMVGAPGELLFAGMVRRAGISYEALAG